MSNPYQPNLGDPDYAYTQQPPAPVLAGWPLRFASGLLDFIITGVLTGVASMASQAFGYVVALIVLIVFGVLEGTRGQTPGKMVVGLRTLKLVDGSLLGAGLGICRRILHVLDYIPCLVGYLWPLWDEKRQTFADKLVKSVVIKVQ
jgi:uncharacterized RDD family membrane protein YckC